MLALQPGLGHAYLRSWVRAVLWFGLWAMTVLVVVPAPGAPATEPVAFLRGLATGMQTLEIEASLALGSVTAFSVIDAYWLGARTAVRDEAAASQFTCPACGRETDPELGFCQWCTTEFDADDASDEPRASGAGAGEAP
ncbi:MAG: zinc ribbon domain-containing protein [Haloglomus sp.]